MSTYPDSSRACDHVASSAGATPTCTTVSTRSVFGLPQAQAMPPAPTIADGELVEDLW